MSAPSRLTRREILELGITSGLAAGLAPLAAGQTDGVTPAPADGPRRASDRKAASPRNVIFMVADGMSFGVLALLEPFARQVRGRGACWTDLLGQPGVTHGLFETHAHNTLVTDSAAASTAWASGVRVANGALNIRPDRTELAPIGRLVRDAGRRVGLVTTTTITHATPAGFVAIQANRDDEHLIAPQYLERVDVLMGGGSKFFEPAQREDKRDLRGEFAARGYALWNSRADVLGRERPAKVLGLFASGHLPYTVDQRHARDLSERVPTLAEMTQAALEVLEAAPHGYLLQVEGGRVDHAAHNNDAAAALWDLLAFDDALAAVLAYAARRPDTLVIVTSDHGTANPGLNGMGGGYRESTRCFERVARASASFEACLGRWRATRPAPAGAELRDAVKSALGVELEAAELELLHEGLAGRLPAEPNRQHANHVGLLGQLTGNHHGIGWTGVSHTADYVLVTALGPGAERFGGLLKNTDVYLHMAELWGITHRNPPLDAGAAAQPQATVWREERPHWT
ncbi:MAG: alkaline phosphatase [Planctomycetota bacterium]